MKHTSPEQRGLVGQVRRMEGTNQAQRALTQIGLVTSRALDILGSSDIGDTHELYRTNPVAVRRRGAGAILASTAFSLLVAANADRVAAIPGEVADTASDVPVAACVVRETVEAYATGDPGYKPKPDAMHLRPTTEVDRECFGMRPLPTDFDGGVYGASINIAHEINSGGQVFTDQIRE